MLGQPPPRAGQPIPSHNGRVPHLGVKSTKLRVEAQMRDRELRATLSPRCSESGGQDYFWITEHTQHGDRGRSYAVSIVGFSDDEVSRETRYFANPFEASRWRAQWVRYMEK